MLECVFCSAGFFIRGFLFDVQMGETRSGKYGRFQAEFVRLFLKFIGDEDYKRRFVDAMGNYVSGEWEFGREVEDIEILDPVQFARLIREGWQLMYQEATSGRAKESFLENL